MHRPLGSISATVRGSGRGEPAHHLNHRIRLTVQTQLNGIPTFSFKIFLRGDITNFLKLSEETKFMPKISVSYINIKIKA